MNPTPPIPAPEGEVPPRLCIDMDELKAYPPNFSHADFIPYVPEAALLAEKQRGLRAVGEARRDAFTECGVCYDCGEELDDLCDCAAKEPSNGQR